MSKRLSASSGEKPKSPVPPQKGGQGFVIGGALRLDLDACYRQCDDHGSAAAELALQVDPSFMLLDDVHGDCEAEADAALLAIPCFVRPDCGY